MTETRACATCRWWARDNEDSEVGACALTVQTNDQGQTVTVQVTDRDFWCDAWEPETAGAR